MCRRRKHETNEKKAASRSLICAVVDMIPHPAVPPGGEYEKSHVTNPGDKKTVNIIRNPMDIIFERCMASSQWRNMEYHNIRCMVVTIDHAL